MHFLGVVLRRRDLCRRSPPVSSLSAVSSSEESHDVSVPRPRPLSTLHERVHALLMRKGADRVYLWNQVCVLRTLVLVL